MAILFYADNADDEIVVSFSDTANNGTPTVLRRFDAPSGLRGLQGVFAHGTFISLIDWPSKDIFRVPAKTANGATIPASDVFRWNMSSSVTNPLAVAVGPDGTFYVANEAADDEIVVLTPPTVNNGNATEVRKFDMPDTVTAATGMTISPDGETLYVGNQPNRKIVAFPANTENGETPAAADVHEITLPSDATSTQGLTLVDGELHVADLGGFVSVITADTDDWGTATRSRKYNHPAGIGQIRGIAGWNGAAVTLGTPVHVTGNRWHVRATLSGEGLTGFDSSDVRVNLGTVNAVVDEGNNVYRIEVDAPATGTGTVTVTVRAGAVRGGNAAVNRNFRFPPLPLGIEAVDEQFIVIGTEDYALVIDITGNPDSVDAKGHMEGFFSNWDATQRQLRIEAEEVTRLITGVTWDLEVIKGTETLTPKIKYNVIPAAPIFEALGTIHLYRGVEIFFDIHIENIPALIIPNARLIGLKSELFEQGVHVTGNIPADAVFASDRGNVTIIVPSDTNEEADVHNYPYAIEAGSPPAIGTPIWTPKGNFGELMFEGVNHALGYEWQLEGQDGWHAFSEARPVIHPSTIEVTPGNLEVTIQFPNIAGASRYEYRLESETHEVDWTQFTGTLANGMITTIVPDLEDGVEYTLRLRVGSPWIGAPVSIKVYGGRLVYTVHDDDANSVLIAVNTGQAPNDASQTAQAIKRFFLPTGLENPIALAIDGDTVYCYDNHTTASEKAIYMFSLSTANDQRATVIKKFKLPAATHTNPVRDIFYFDGKLYIAQHLSRVQGGLTYEFYLYTVDPAATANNATAAIINGWHLDDRSLIMGLSVTEPFIRTISKQQLAGNSAWIATWDRTPIDYSEIPRLSIKPIGGTNVREGDILGDKVYVSISTAHINVIDLASEARTAPVVKAFGIPHRHRPSGLAVSR